MSSSTVESGDRIRGNAIDVLIFCVAVVLSVLAIVELGALGLGVGCVLLSGAAALVVSRQEGAVAEQEISSNEDVVVDGGRTDD